MKKLTLIGWRGLAPSAASFWSLPAREIVAHSPRNRVVVGLSKIRTGCLAVAAVAVLVSGAFGQTITSGDLTGTVSDASGAVIPQATLTLKSLDTGETKTAQSGDSGVYRFNLLRPGSYQLSGTSPGLRSDIGRVSVTVGQVVTANLVLKVEEAKQVVLVTEAAPLLQIDNANMATTFSTQQVDDLPAPGSDISTVAFTVPGISVNTGGGYGNFSSHGLPGTANLFTMNGNDYNDPYLNLNNTGASNLMLGQNEISEVSVVQNAYSVQYGRNAGAQISFITKSGTNQFHGNLVYNWNGSVLNANDFFNNLNGIDKPRAVSNNWGASIGGPAIKNKLFFFMDTEGIRYVLPTSGVVTYPSPQFESYILGHIPAVSVPLYTSAFSEFSGAKGQPVTTGNAPTQDASGTLGCGDFAGTAAGGGGIFGTNTPCAYSYATNGTNQNREWLMTSRVDWNINDKNKIYFRYKGDHGFQPTGTNLVSPTYNVQSIQPQQEGQINWTSTISPTMVNSFIGSVLWYSAIFTSGNLTQAASTLPVNMDIIGSGGSNGGAWYPIGFGYEAAPGADEGYNIFPQGRDVGQLGLVDDLSKIVGKHTLKFGANLRKNRVTDYVLNENTYGTYTFNTVTDFANGVTNPNTNSNYVQAFAPSTDSHIRFYNVGFYAQDEWNVKDNLKITFGVRLERTADPSCLDKCFSLLSSPITAGTSINTPYNQSIETGLTHGYPSVTAVNPLPRVGVVWKPQKGSSNSTVVRAGFGIFADLPPGGIIENLITNEPYLFTGDVFSGAPVGLATAPGSAAAGALAQYNAFKTGYANGETFNQLNSSIPGGFSPIDFFSVPKHLDTPQYLEWSFEIEQPIGAKNVFVATYAGTHGYNLLLDDPFVNTSVNTANFPNGFGGLPLTPPDARFNYVTQVVNNGVSNYDGLILQFRRALGFGFQGQIGYTWSHALDDLSSLPGEPYNFANSLVTMTTPNLKANYSNSDFDIRNSLVADFVWNSPFKPSSHALGWLVGNWTVSGKFYLRSGEPFSVTDSTLPGLISNAIDPQIPTVMTAQATGNIPAKGCGSIAAVSTPCFSASAFVGPGAETGYGLPRNSFYGPGYFDIDTAVYKHFPIKEWGRFTVGAQFFNILNHPNFADPNSNIAAPGLGLITSTVSAPTSAYGAFQGSAVAGRVIAFSGRFSF
jgi:hypothetical protein